LVNITASQIKTEWEKSRRQRKPRTDSRRRFFGNVRGIFVFLFASTIFVFAFNHYVQIQTYASAKLDNAMNHITTSKRLRQYAVTYEQQVDEASQASK
ncbi:MAG TPA: hypothetical protein VMV89_01850, partial [Candidatus Paceibacterota bacterium]|nr:hypothetical protein [Candidatus Paceibacterota bacterium]